MQCGKSYEPIRREKTKNSPSELIRQCATQVLVIGTRWNAFAAKATAYVRGNHPFDSLSLVQQASPTKKSNGISGDGWGMLRPSPEGRFVGSGREMDRSKAPEEALQSIPTASASDEPARRDRQKDGGGRVMLPGVVVAVQIVQNFVGDVFR